MTTILSSIFGLALVASVASNGGPIPQEAWVPVAGDRVIVDTQANVGYLVHEDGTYLEFPVLTGQKRYVYYIGRGYYAATPEKTWTVREVEVKGRSMTFGETGTFLRLYDEGERTAYGIHSHLTFEKMLSEGDRYRSMGCVLVSEDILKLIVKTFETNGNALDVATVNGVTLPEPAPDVSQVPSWLGL